MNLEKLRILKYSVYKIGPEFKSPACVIHLEIVLQIEVKILLIGPLQGGGSLAKTA